MRRNLLITALVVGLALAWNVSTVYRNSAFAQAAPDEKKGPVLTLKGNSMQVAPEGIRVTGSVSFTLPDGTTVTADDAIVTTATQQLELLGTVRIKLKDGVRLAVVADRPRGR